LRGRRLFSFRNTVSWRQTSLTQQQQQHTKYMQYVHITHQSCQNTKRH